LRILSGPAVCLCEAREVTSRTIKFSVRVGAGEVVRIAKTGENVLVLRERWDGYGHVVKRGMGALKRQPFGVSDAVVLKDALS